MSRNGSVDLDLGSETYRFRLGIGDLEDLQEATSIGPSEHLLRLYHGDRYVFRHVREIIRAGLIGGGFDHREALAVARTLDDLPTAEVATVAMLALTAAMEQPEAEEVPTRGAKQAEPSLPDGQMRFAAFYGSAAVMSLAPSEMRAMSLWQFQAYVSGFNRANDPNGTDPLTSQEEDALWAWMNSSNEHQAENGALNDGN